MRISDWSADVCASDLLHVEDAASGWPGLPVADAAVARIGDFGLDADLALRLSRRGDGAGGGNAGRERGVDRSNAHVRSEERRVGKECVSPGRSRWLPEH